MRSLIGVVAQDCILFNDTIKYNVSYGAVSQNLSEEEMEKKLEIAVKDACIDEFIRNAKDGWNTTVGERGLRLRSFLIFNLFYFLFYYLFFFIIFLLFFIFLFYLKII